ncbi:hypothetical protein [Nocardia higoensis]|uniref:hypothetical protein n=1 Tax=Nocardia higoensis TaxID=228599 RepID=UPI00031B3750|nr:hypothetical protein [Nocardia higoensis]
MFHNIIEPLQDLAEQNRDLIGYVVINLGNEALSIVRWGLEVLPPLLQPYFAQ